MEINRKALSDLMITIHKNTENSACIDNFENLLNEIRDPVFVNTVVNSMHNMLTETFELFNAVKKVPQKRFKSKMISTSFIKPMRFFNKVKHLANEAMEERSVIEFLSGEKSDITVNTEGKKIILEDDSMNTAIFSRMKDLYESNDIDLMNHLNDIKENARKEMLIWNYIPAVIKAIIQTKRRSLGMDTNSKRFSHE